MESYAFFEYFLIFPKERTNEKEGAGIISLLPEYNMEFCLMSDLKMVKNAMGEWALRNGTFLVCLGNTGRPCHNPIYWTKNKELVEKARKKIEDERQLASLREMIIKSE